MAEIRDPVDLGVVFTDRSRTMRKNLRVGMYDHVEGEIKEDCLMANIRLAPDAEKKWTFENKINDGPTTACKLFISLLVKSEHIWNANSDVCEYLAVRLLLLAFRLFVLWFTLRFRIRREWRHRARCLARGGK